MAQTQVLTDEERGKAALKALKKAQDAFAGAAERAGIYSEEDVVKLCKEVRRELRAAHPELYGRDYARHG